MRERSREGRNGEERKRAKKRGGRGGGEEAALPESQNEGANSHVREPVLLGPVKSRNITGMCWQIRETGTEAARGK